MKKLLFLLSLLFSAVCFSQTVNTIIMDPGQMDSTVINGVKYYKIITGTTSKEKADLQAAANTNVTQDGKILEIQQKNTLQDAAIAAAGGGTASPAPKTITASTYTITQADNGGKLYFSNSCKVFYSGLSVGFSCRCFEKGGQVTFTGTYISKWGRKLINTQWGMAGVDVDGSGNVWLTGDLK